MAVVVPEETIEVISKIYPLFYNVRTIYKLIEELCSSYRLPDFSDEYVDRQLSGYDFIHEDIGITTREDRQDALGGIIKKFLLRNVEDGDLQILAGFIKPFMEQEVHRESNRQKQKQDRKKILQALGRDELEYLKGGRIRPIIQIQDIVTSVSNTLHEALPEGFEERKKKLENAYNEEWYDNVLVQAGILLEETYLEYAKKHGIPACKNSSHLAEPVLEHMKPHLKNVDEKYQEIFQALRTLVKKIKALRDQYGAHGTKEPQKPIPSHNAALVMHAALTLSSYILACKEEI